MSPPSSTRTRATRIGWKWTTRIPPLFGWLWENGSYRRTTENDRQQFYLRAFEPQDFAKVIDEFTKSMAGGGAAVAKVTTTTVENKRFGISAGRVVEVAFFVNYHADSFWNALSQDVRKPFQKKHGKLDFPYFDTVWNMRLEPQDVNLLATAMSWNLTTHRELVLSMFGSGKEA